MPQARVIGLIIYLLIRGREEAMRRETKEQMSRELIRRERIGVMITGEVAETRRSTNRRGNHHQRHGANLLSSQNPTILDCVLARLFLLLILYKPFQNQHQALNLSINFLVKKDFLAKRVFLPVRRYLSLGLLELHPGLRSMVTDISRHHLNIQDP